MLSAALAVAILTTWWPSMKVLILLLMYSPTDTKSELESSVLFYSPSATKKDDSSILVNTPNGSEGGNSSIIVYTPSSQNDQAIGLVLDCTATSGWWRGSSWFRSWCQVNGENSLLFQSRTRLLQTRLHREHANHW